jgi:hypothetical protein
MPGPIAMAGLIEALGCESKQVSIRANRSLGRIDDESVVRHLSGVEVFSVLLNDILPTARGS